MKHITENPSPYRHLERRSTLNLLTAINQEDHQVPEAVAKAIPAIASFVEVLVSRMLAGGRLFYIGAGTSGRLGILDASECPPTFGVSQEKVIGLIAGGDQAIRKAVEFAEDDIQQAWIDLQAYQITEKDTLLGIAASGTTPYVVSGLLAARQNNILTACISCNPNSPLAQAADHSIEVIVGPEFLTGSTRMKAGTAQKLVLNMISTSTMIKLGYVLDNQMVDMQLNNEKLRQRGQSMLMQTLGISVQEAQHLLSIHGSVRKAIIGYSKSEGLGNK